MAARVSTRWKSNARSANTWPEANLRITRYPSISADQFLGCVAAFVDSFTGELNAAAAALRRLEGKSKGSAFAYEMTLDTHRYGALIVLDRWSTLTTAFGPHLAHPIVENARGRVESAEQVLGRVNQVIDTAGLYATEVVEACLMAFQSLSAIFNEERATAEQNSKLGPMLSEDYTSARRIFLEDLAAR
jgi:hypothetical protein